MAYITETNGSAKRSLGDPAAFDQTKRSKLEDDSINRNSRQWDNSMMERDDIPGHRKRDETERINHILLFTILNPMYPITTDVLHTICSTYGQVLRIVIFKKHGVQGMVEFENIESAKRAKESLHGADIYSGCCTLKIDFAKPTKLNVYKNDSESWDYTNPNLGSSSTKEGRSGPLLQEPRFGSAPVPYRGSGSEPLRAQVQFANMPYDRFESGYSRPINGPTPSNGPPAPYHDTPPFERFPPDRYDVYGGVSSKEEYSFRSGSLRTSPPASADGGVMSGGMGGNGRPMQQGAVMMVYGLAADKFNANKIFNIFCLYGNVVRVKFLKSKDGCAMVQMGDALSVDRSMSNFNNTYMFGSKVQLGYSKQVFISDVQNPHTLLDGTPSFKDFMGNKNNRFLNPEMASKNRIQPPTKTLHFFNTPPSIDEDEIRQVFVEAQAPQPKIIKLFSSKSERSSSGLLEYESLTEAVEALCIMNHCPIRSTGAKFPFIMKLCFSSSRHQLGHEEK